MTTLHSMMFEQAVLSTLMTVADSLNALEIKPTVEDFYATRHQEIFKAIENLNIQGKPYDFVMVKDFVETQGKMNLVGGEQYFLELSQETAAAFFNLNSYISKLKN